MKIIETSIEGVLLIEPDIYRDNRGFFLETYSEKRYFQKEIKIKFVQDNLSSSKKNTLRGLHYQLKNPQGKLVRVSRGTVFDVALDIRKDSSSFGKYFSTILDDQKFHQLYMPPGIAHGFCVLSNFADFEYKCTDFYSPENDRGILWNDPDLAINWPVKHPIVSSKDQGFKRLSEIPVEDLI